MFLQSFRTLLASCRYQSAHREILLFLGKALFGANVVWLIGNMVSSAALGIAAHSAEELIFYVLFTLILSLISTIVIKRAASKTVLSLSDIAHQGRGAFISQFLYAFFLIVLVSLPCVFAVFARAMKSVPILGYLFRQVYEAIEPLFMISLFLVFLAALLLPLITPFLLLLTKQPTSHWKELYHEKLYPRIVSSFTNLFVAYLFWFIIEALKCTIEWFFPVDGILAACIRAALYTTFELFAFWACLRTYFDAARSKIH